MYVCCGVGCVRLSRCMWMRTARRVAVAWLRGFEWMRMVLDVGGVGRCCGRVGWVLEFAVVLGWTARRFCCCLVEDFFIFCLRRGGGYMYS